MNDKLFIPQRMEFLGSLHSQTAHYFFR